MHLKIDDLAEVNLRELTDEECESLQGGLSIAEGYGNYGGWYFNPDYNPQPQPQPQPDNEPIINNVQCSNHPNDGSGLPWCAVVL